MRTSNLWLAICRLLGIRLRHLIPFFFVLFAYFQFDPRFMTCRSNLRTYPICLLHRERWSPDYVRMHILAEKSTIPGSYEDWKFRGDCFGFMLVAKYEKILTCRSTIRSLSSFWGYVTASEIRSQFISAWMLSRPSLKSYRGNCMPSTNCKSR